MRKVLYLKWDCFCEEYIVAALRKEGFEVELYPIPYGKADVSLRRNEEIEKALKDKIGDGKYEFVFSFNFFPAVSYACNEVNVIYVSWTYDSPFMYLYDKAISMPTNRAFIFDSATVNELNEKGVETAFYLPMAAPVDLYDKMIPSSAERKKYSSDVSFVGSLYTESRQNLISNLNGITQETAGFVETIINMQLQSYAVPVLEQLLKMQPQIVADMQRVCPIPIAENEMQSPEWMYANYFLARNTTARERTQLMSLLDGNFDTALYTPEGTPQFEKIKNRGPVDYCDVMPLVFKNSKINLNISLKSIYSGIPLRAFDIMGCGGFLLTDFQQDYSGLFIPDEDYVFYTTPEDFINKVAYYLEHEDERNRIAKNAHDKVKEAHTYMHRLRTIIERVL